MVYKWSTLYFRYWAISAGLSRITGAGDIEQESRSESLVFYKYHFDPMFTHLSSCVFNCQHWYRYLNIWWKSSEIYQWNFNPWWLHQVESFPRYWALCEGNPLVTSGFPSQRPVTRSFDVFFDLRLNKYLSQHRDAANLRRHRAYYGAIVMEYINFFIH